MEQKFPKNIRQIGNVSDSTKVYVEDYVDTYFSQLCDKVSEKPKGTFLVGEVQKEGQEQYILISGAIQMDELEYDGTDVVLGENTWKKGCEDSKRYFEGKAILGWCLIENDLPLKTTTKLVKTHQKIFHKKNRIFVMVDAVEKEQKYFKYKFNDLMELGGHFIYYEKNPLMQDYMIAKRKENCVTPSETFEDRATKDFRSIIREKEVVVGKKKKNRASYLVSTAALIVALGIGVTSANDYNKMQEIGKNITNKIQATLGRSEEVVEEEPEKEETPSEPLDSAVAEESDVNASLVKPEDIIEEESNKNKEYNIGEGDEEVKPDIDTSIRYTVKSGDTLASISREKYGTISKINDICEANNLNKEDYLQIGQSIILP